MSICVCAQQAQLPLLPPSTGSAPAAAAAGVSSGHGGVRQEIRATRDMQTLSAFVCCLTPSAPVRGEERAALAQRHCSHGHSPLRLEHSWLQDGQTEVLA